jgi:outer membrane receptor protein involved in Fe transport
MKTAKLLISLAITAPGFLFAQDTTTDDEDVFELSPFTVDASSDSGYLASQTLAGTRLATNLRDTPSPITVLTMDYLEDIDATDINEALAFVPSTDSDPRAYNSLNNNPVSTTVRGFRNTQNNVNFFQTRVSIDRYNISRFEINRGPNAILFGISNPGGTYTATTKNAYFKNGGRWWGGHSDGDRLELRVDSYDSWRFVGDYNQVLLEDRLAVRFAGMTEDRKGFIHPMSDRDERFYFALTGKVADTRNFDMNVRYQFELVDQETTVRDWNLAWDNISDWQDAGSPTWDSADQVPSAEPWPAGMRQMPNAFTVSVTTNGSAVAIPTFIYGNRPTSAQSGTSGNLRYRLGSDFSTAMIPETDTPIPTDLSYSGPMKGFELESISHAVFADMTFFDEIHAEFAWWRQETDRDWNRSNGGQDIYVDLLKILPSGEKNENVGKLFTQGNIRIQEQYREIENFRLTLAYELDLTESSQWLGRHRLAVLLENSRDLLGLNDYVDVNMSSSRFANNLTTFSNRVVRRNYLFNGGGNVWEPMSSPGGGSYVPLSGTVDPGSARDQEPFQTGLANFRISRGETETDSWVFAMQSFFLNDRLIPFLGIRGDDQDSSQLINDEVVASKVRGIFPDWRTIPHEVASNFKDETFTWGVIGRVTPKFDLFYNSSEVLSPGSSRSDLNGDVVPPSTGEGWDAGVRFNLIDGKLIGSISYYESSQKSIPLFNTLGGQDGTAFNNFLDGLIELEGQGLVPDLDYESRKVTTVNAIDTLDNDAHGIDIEVTYNPSKYWRIRLLAAKTLNVESNVQERSQVYVYENIYPMESQLDGSLVVNGDTIDLWYENLRLEEANEKFGREGVIQQRLPEWKFSLVTSYQFREWNTTGWQVGGNVRYNSKLHVQALLDADKAFTGDYVYSKERYIFGLFLDYQKVFSNGIRMNVRLNVDNVFDEDAHDVHQANALSGEIFAIRPYQGRSASLVTSFRF